MRLLCDRRTARRLRNRWGRTFIDTLGVSLGEELAHAAVAKLAALARALGGVPIADDPGSHVQTDRHGPASSRNSSRNCVSQTTSREKH